MTCYKFLATPLLVAVDDGHVQIVEQLLNSGVDVNSIFNSSSSNDFTSLLHLAGLSDKDVTKLLLYRDAHAYCKNDDGETPLHAATEKGHVQIINHLLNYGADINSPCKSSNCKGRRALHFASEIGNVEITKLLLSRGADVHCASYNGETPLHTAAHKGHLVIVKQLLSSGADVNSAFTSSCLKGLTPLQLAVRRGDEEISKFLLSKGAHVDCTLQDGESPLHTTARIGNEEIMKLLLGRGANINCSRYNGETPLHIAAYYGHLKIAEHLLNHGANINSAYTCRVTNNEYTSLSFAVQKNHEKVVELLLKRGANSNSTYENGGTLLHIAAFNGHLKIVKHLLKQGADINSTYTSTCLKGLTPLHMAAKGGRETVIKLLLVYGANATIKIEDGCTALNASPTKCAIVETLSKYQKEIEHVKREKIGDSKVSYFDILSQSVNQLGKYASNENIVQILKSDDYKTKFPIFASMISTCFKKGLERRELLIQGSKLINHLFSFSDKNFHELPQNCTERIVSYLSNNHLRVFIDA